MIRTRTSKTRILVNDQPAALSDRNQFHGPGEVTLEFMNRMDYPVSVRVNVTAGNNGETGGFLERPQVVEAGGIRKFALKSNWLIADILVAWTQEPYNINHERRSLSLIWIRSDAETVTKTS